MRRFDRKAEKPQMPRRIASDVTLQRDVPVPMGDGVPLMANVFRSFPPRRSPVLMSVTPYGKDALPDRLGFFYGYNGFANDGVAKGWLRVSHRALDPERSRPGRPWHTHRQRQPVQPDEVVPVEIEVLASSTHFEAGTRLCVEVLGHDAARYPAFKH